MGQIGEKIREVKCRVGLKYSRLRGARMGRAEEGRGRTEGRAESVAGGVPLVELKRGA